MATYRILSWHGIPVGVRARDGAGEARAQLHVRFQNAVDAVATATGRTGTEIYLAGWSWGESLERAGAARAVADAVAEELEATYTSDRLRALKAQVVAELSDDGETVAPRGRGETEGSPT